ncbi:MAG: hypothetical protein GY884_14465 [Proteobacteria bacterium]|nr:hypothetical protein [Pseudomonadota bacterium]
MFRQDMLVRQITQLAEATMRVAGLVRRSQLAKAHMELDAAGRMFLGLDVAHLEALSDDDLVAFSTIEGQVDGTKCLQMAELLRLAAVLGESEGQDGNARRTRALDLLLVGWLNDPNLRDERIDRMISGLEFQTRMGRPEGLTDRVVRWARASRRLPLVEDLVFEGNAPEAALWELAALTDDELVEGGLPRTELQTALADLSARSSSQ